MDIDVSLVRRLILKQFPRWAGLLIKPVELSGWDNRTFRLGDDMTVRLPSHEAYEAQVKKEQQWLPRLASRLPIAIPTPIAMGTPSEEYPLHWSIYRWIDGENATTERITNLNDFAIELAQFLNTLQQIDANGGPPPGAHNFYRGGPLGIYDRETRNAIADLNGMIDRVGAITVWESAIQTVWNTPPVWVHGDVYPTNLLVKDRRLSAVIDFGCSGVGDPACDLTIAWTFFFGESRETFRSHLQLDDATWERARGWALWKALTTIAYPSNYPSGRLEESLRVIKDVIAEHKPR
ncbi:aminoglycoside phosphotransferase family protein [Alicyclobacillus fastidiosus]|uniref:Aminoglycoside phosphotransferase family protein n=1 Tax=Alicyclobacillus fastidiosus TaxID=392011 RepID=A0ABY6ZKG2_9BACL|nr:aminoglycoside phosphotransferase family protein [Alicyclobacillus fastidiosus]WAH42967.1 aminoglycoside phosphotransferase family protein [Alicyclobacillus fastidiosus]